MDILFYCNINKDNLKFRKHKVPDMRLAGTATLLFGFLQLIIIDLVQPL